MSDPGDARAARPVFVADSFQKAFAGRPVLAAASCTATPGHITVLLGRNGCGKTTLLRCALGLTRADNGVLHWDGRAHLRPRLARLAGEGLFYLPHDGLLSRRLSVADHFAALAHRFPEAVAPPARDPLDIGSLSGRRPGELSGGELRRVELSLAILRGPRCLVADEPMLGVAPKDQSACADAFRRLADAGAAILVTGHEVDRLLDLADEVIWMVAGGTYVLGSPAEAARHPQFRNEYLGSRGAGPP